MVQNILQNKYTTLILGLILGLLIGYLIFFRLLPSQKQDPVTLIENELNRKVVIGFLPYWLAPQALTDYSEYINTLTYFGLTVGNTGEIIKMNNPQETEPGWHALNSGKIDPFLDDARKHHQKLSLLIFSGNEDNIYGLIDQPELHAQTLVSEVKPIMQQYKFTDLNLDIESVYAASDEARLKFTRFVKEVKKQVKDNGLGTVTIDIAPDAVAQKYLIDLPAIKDYVDYVVLMGYDFHYIGSTVTGPVAPLNGVGSTSEFDVATALSITEGLVNKNKIILGIPAYGYQWETLRDATRSATIPSSGISISNQKIDQFLKNCASCSATLDADANENYLIYQDQTGTYSQTFFPSYLSTQAKVDLVKQKKLKGIAVWALGYEDPEILQPLKAIK